MVDLSQATFIDSTGLRTIVGADRRAHACGVRLVIVPAPPLVHRVFELCGFDRTLPFVPVRPAAAAG